MKNPLTQLSKLFVQVFVFKKRRSPHWPKIRADHLKVESWCRGCGGAIDLEVHHVQPYHINPELELIDTNLITLCENYKVRCHLLKGHLGSWRRINPNILKEAVAVPLSV